MSGPTRDGESGAFPFEDDDCLYTHATGTVCPIHGEILPPPRCIAVSSGRCWQGMVATTCSDGICAKAREYAESYGMAAGG